MSETHSTLIKEPCLFFPKREQTLKVLTHHAFLQKIAYSLDPPQQDIIDLLKKEKFIALEQGHDATSTLPYEFSCAACNACVTLRMNVSKAQLSSSHKRILKKNDKDLTVETISSDGTTTTEMLKLITSYNRARFPNANQKPSETATSASESSHRLEIRDKQKELLGVIHFDVSAETKAANITHFMFEPENSQKRSLGIYLLLKTIEKAHSTFGVEHIYFGQWVKDTPNMDYKKGLPGLETIVDGIWVDFDPEIHTRSSKLKPLETLFDIT